MIIEIDKTITENVEQIKLRVGDSWFSISEDQLRGMIINKTYGENDSNISIKPRSGNSLEVK